MAPRLDALRERLKAVLREQVRDAPT